MPSTKQDVAQIRQKIEKVLGRFTLEEMRDILLPSFSKMLWNEIEEQVMEERNSLSSKSIAAVLVDNLGTQRVDIERLEVIYLKFTLLDISLHSRRRQWHTFIMEGHSARKLWSESDLQEQIGELCEEQLGTIVRIRVHRRDDFYWLAIQERKPAPKRKTAKKAKLEYTAPVVIAACMGDPYLFVPHKPPSEAVLQILTQTLGYASLKIKNFTGNNLHEMLKALHIQQRQAVEIPVLTTRLSTLPLEPYVELPGGGLDFSQVEDRRDRATVAFGKEPPATKSQCFVTKVPITNLGEPFAFPIHMTIKSDNVWKTLREMLIYEEGMAFPPAPFYEKAVLLARDVINLKPN